MLSIQLLGDFRVAYELKPVDGLNSPRVQALITYLLLHRNTPLPRHQLAFLFWPDSNESKARANLRYHLYQLRQALPTPDQFLRVEANTLQWRANSPTALDVAQFEQAFEHAQKAAVAQDRALEQSTLQAAADFYQDDLLPSCYDDWIVPERDRLHQLFLEGMDRLVQLLEEQQDYPSAIHFVQRLLQHDSYHEAAHRQLMRLYALNGERARALRTYYIFASVLERELGVEPAAATQEVYTALLDAADEPSLPLQSGETVSAQTLIGREQEWQQVLAAWHRATRGDAHFLLISGEAGIGKTRLAEELLVHVNRLGIACARTRAYAAEGRLAYAPITAWLREKSVRPTVASIDDLWQVEIARLLPELLIERPYLPSPQPMRESWQRQRLFEALVRTFLSIRSPLLLLLDDLQWCDQDTLEWLFYLLRYDVHTRLMVVGTVRPEEITRDHPLRTLQADLHSTGQLSEVALGPLNERQSSTLSTQLYGKALDPDMEQYLFAETEGYPLFIIETIRAMIERNAQPEDADTQLDFNRESTSVISSDLERLSLPPRIHSLIQRRLTQISVNAQMVAEMAAVIGREFTFEVLNAASDQDETAVVRGLDELWRRRIVREQGTDAYDFSHDKIREVAYTQLSRTHRRLLHRAVADTLTSIYASKLDEVSGHIAAHYEQANMPEQAAHFYLQVAQAATAIFAHHDAIEIYQKGLTQLAHLPVSQVSAEIELALRLGLGTAHIVTEGYGISAVWETYSHAQRLTQKLGYPQNPVILRALATYYLTRRRLPDTEIQGKKIRELAHNDPDNPDPVLLVESDYVLGATHFYWGNFDTAHKHLLRGWEQYDIEQHPTHVAHYAQDAGVVCLIRLAHVLWYLGYADQARNMCDKALTLAKELNHTFTTAYALTFAAWLHNDYRDQTATETLADMLIAHCREYRMAYFSTQGMVLKGWSMVVRGEAASGNERIRAGIRIFEESQQDVYRPYILATLARSYAHMGKVEQGLEVLGEGLEGISQFGDRWYEAELHRLSGELLGMLPHNGDSKQALLEKRFEKAVKIARGKKSKALELRAVMSLCRLWVRQGRALEAHQLLKQTYAWFSEGFDSPDLKQARAFLHTLS